MLYNTITVFYMNIQILNPSVYFTTGIRNIGFILEVNPILTRCLQLFIVLYNKLDDYRESD